ncbi:MAG: hypothetical protein QOD67_822, partial [Caballeronia sp.]|nr:hypothetical protein [Caballeronia sp.]
HYAAFLSQRLTARPHKAKMDAEQVSPFPAGDGRHADPKAGALFQRASRFRAWLQASYFRP